MTQQKDGWLFSATHKTNDSLEIDDCFITPHPEDKGPEQIPDAWLAVARSMLKSGEWYQVTLSWATAAYDTDYFWLVCLDPNYRGGAVKDENIQCQWMG
jgi:hypothetical protein